MTLPANLATDPKCIDPNYKPLSLDPADVDQLSSQGFCVIDEALSPQLLSDIKTESGLASYEAACLTQGVQSVAIRGDRIRWIDDTCPYAAAYLAQLLQFGQTVNQAFFTNIKHVEGHYACYPVGFGYDWHKDNPKGRDERVFSLVLYLNDDWTADDGGMIELIDNKQNTQHLLPKANRLVIFDSNLSHKVHITQRVRYSLTAWLRRDMPM